MDSLPALLATSTGASGHGNPSRELVKTPRLPTAAVLVGLLPANAAMCSSSHSHGRHQHCGVLVGFHCLAICPSSASGRCCICLAFDGAMLLTWSFPKTVRSFMMRLFRCVAPTTVVLYASMPADKSMEERSGRTRVDYDAL